MNYCAKCVINYSFKKNILKTNILKSNVESVVRVDRNFVVLSTRKVVDGRMMYLALALDSASFLNPIFPLEPEYLKHCQRFQKVFSKNY